jgi:hypothetical protein
VTISLDVGVLGRYNGRKEKPTMKLISKSNIKLRKGEKMNYLSFGLSMAPHNMSGYNVCPNASAGCIAGCVYFSGNGYYPAVQTARINRTRLWFENREEFKTQLKYELRNAIKMAKRKGMKLCVRLNVFSDIPWELTFAELFKEFPTVQFYDYTKNPRRMKKFICICGQETSTNSNRELAC